ncbi:MAG: Gfo/Idh/MocA family oxidoreductase [candidate division WS1 bacterium]|nr:Gfo/Idh/MocA family oxidoreductase [candidate division WS1 bacterium]
MPLSVGVVGCGAFGKHFIELIRDHPEVERMALCDLDPDKLAECSSKYEISECYNSLDDLLKTDLQAVMIFTQPWLHAPQAIEAMEAGKHAYTAVPIIMLPSGDEMLDWCDRVVETASRTGQLYMMGETTCYRAESIFCRRKAAAGEFGHFCYAEGHYFHDIEHNLKNVAMWRWGKDWDDSKRGGIPMHYPTHSTGGIIDITGAHMTQVSAMGYEMPNEDWHLPGGRYDNVYGNMVGLYRMSNGMVVRIAEMRRIGTPGLETFRLYGTAGAFERNFNGSIWLTLNGQEEVDLTEVSDPLPDALAANKGGHGGSHAYLVHEFVTACIEERQPLVNAWQAARFVAPGVMAYKSIQRDGELLDVPDWGDAPE